MTCWKILRIEAFADEQSCSNRRMRINNCFAEEDLLCGWTTALRMNKPALRTKDFLEIAKSCSSDDQSLSDDHALRILFAIRMKTCLCEDYNVLRTLLSLRMKTILCQDNALWILFSLRMKTTFAKTMLCGYCSICGWSRALRMCFSFRILLALRINWSFSDVLILRE